MDATPCFIVLLYMEIGIAAVADMAFLLSFVPVQSNFFGIFLTPPELSTFGRTKIA